MKNTDLKQKDELVLHYEGKTHEISIETFTKSLLSLSKVIQEVNNGINPDQKIDVTIKATKEGSFKAIIGFAAEHAKTLLAGASVENVTSIIQAFVAILGLKKHTKGVKPQSIERHGDDIHVKNTLGNVFILNNTHFHIAENQNIKEQLAEHFDALREDPNVSGYEILDQSEKMKLFEAERSDFDDLSKKSDILLEHENKRVQVEAATLHVFKVSFNKEFKWEFFWRGEKMSAYVIDKEFYERIDKNEVVFGKGDIMEVDLEIHQIYNTDIKAYINEEYRVDKVRELRHPPGVEKLL